MRRAVIPTLLLAVSLCCGQVASAAYVNAVISDGPMAYWRLGESSGPTAYDATTPAYDGTYNNIGLGAPGALPTEPANKAAGFGGSGDNRMRVPHNAAFNSALSGSFTWEGWIFDAGAAPNNSNNYSIFYKADSGNWTNNSVWFYRTRQEGKYIFTVKDPSGVTEGLTFDNPGGALAAGDKQWHQYAVVFDRANNTKHAYKDGIQVVSGGLGAQGAITNTGNVILGVDHNNNSEWKGRMDEVALYPSALSAQDIQAHYQAAVGGPPTTNYVTDGLEVYYDARDFSINGIPRDGSWKDRSGNGNDATLSGAAYFANESPAPPLFGGVGQQVLMMDPNPDASGQVGSAVGSQGIALPGGVTVEALFRLPRKDPGAGAQIQTIVNATGTGPAPSYYRKWNLQARDGDEGNVLRFHIRGEDHNWYTVESNGLHPDDEWIHVMGVFDENNDNLVKMYVNGMLQSDTATWAGLINPADGIPVIGDPHEGTMEGAVAFARIYSRGLSQEEVLLNYANARNYFTPEPSTLLVWALLAGIGAASGRRRKRSRA